MSGYYSGPVRASSRVSRPATGWPCCFEGVGLIRRDRFNEVRFENLERDPIGQMRGVYEALGLPEFGVVEPALGRYVGTLSGYRKNAYPEIPPATRERIAHEWRRCFEAWGYPA